MMHLRKCVNCHSLCLHLLGELRLDREMEQISQEQSRGGDILRCEGEGWEGWISAQEEDNHQANSHFHYCLCEGRMGYKHDEACLFFDLTHFFLFIK